MNLEETIKRFDKHELKEILNTEDLKVFTFREPGTNNLFQKWIIDYNSLIVKGDCFDAIYSWGGKISLDFLANCSLDYFSSKCLADRHGYEQSEFDHNGYEQKMKSIAIEHISSEFNLPEEHLGFDELSDDIKFEKCKQVYLSNSSEMYSEWEFDDLFQHDTENSVHEAMSQHPGIFGEDTWEYNFIAKTITPYFHLAALKSAHNKYGDVF